MVDILGEGVRPFFSERVVSVRWVLYRFLASVGFYVGPGLFFCECVVSVRWFLCVM